MRRGEQIIGVRGKTHLSLWSMVVSSHLGPVVEFAQLPTSAKTNLKNVSVSIISNNVDLKTFLYVIVNDYCYCFSFSFLKN